MCPAKGVELGDVDELSHGAIWLRCVKFNLAFKSNGLNHQFRKLTDGEFLTSTYIDVAIPNLAQARDVTTTTG